MIKDASAVEEYVRKQLWPITKKLKKRTEFLSYVGFEVLTSVVMKSPIFWDMTLCHLLKVN
jgi:hypothetical protein